MKFKKLLAVSKKNLEILSKTCQGSSVNNDPKNFKDLWQHTEDLGVFAQILHSIARTETIIDSIIRHHLLSKTGKNVYDKKMFSCKLTLQEKIERVDKAAKANKFKLKKSKLNEYIRFRNCIAHAEITFGRTKEDIYLIYRQQVAKKVRHIKIEDYISALKEMLEDLFHLLVELDKITFHKYLESTKSNHPPNIPFFRLAFWKVIAKRCASSRTRRSR